MTIGENIVRQWEGLKDMDGSDLPGLDDLIDYAVEDTVFTFTEWVNEYYVRSGKLWHKRFPNQKSEYEWITTEKCYEIFKAQQQHDS